MELPITAPVTKFAAGAGSTRFLELHMLSFWYRRRLPAIASATTPHSNSTGITTSSTCVALLSRVGAGTITLRVSGLGEGA